MAQSDTGADTGAETEGADSSPATGNVTDLAEIRRSKAQPEAIAAKAAAEPARKASTKNRRFNREKVDRLKAAIAAGDYEVDALRVADKFIEHDRH